MATFFAPQPTYKAPTFQELAAPLMLYRDAYNDMEQKYDAQREKNAMLQAMLGSDPDNEISQYMADYNALMDETTRGFSNGTLPYAQLYGNYRKLRDIWNDKGVKMTAAIDSFTKYREAQSKHTGAIGPEYTLWDFHKNPNLSYSFFSPDDIYKAGALSGATYAQQKGPRNGRPAPNGQWIDEYGPTNDEVATAFTDSNNPFYNDANSIMQQYGIDPNSDNAALFRNAYQRGLASSQKLVPSHNVDYVTRQQQITNSRKSTSGASSTQYADIDINNLPEGLQIVDTYKTPLDNVVINEVGTKNYWMYDTVDHTLQIIPRSKLSISSDTTHSGNGQAQASENRYFYEKNNRVVTDANGNPHRVLYSTKLQKFGYLSGGKFYPFKKDYSDKYGYAISGNVYSPSANNETEVAPE